MNERTDRFLANGRWAELPVAGVFVVRDGKIAIWHDYFDLDTIMKQPVGGHPSADGEVTAPLVFVAGCSRAPPLPRTVRDAVGCFGRGAAVCPAQSVRLRRD